MKKENPLLHGFDALPELEKVFRKNFEAEDKAREKGLRLSRQVGRCGAQAVKKIHHADFDGACLLLKEGELSLKSAKKALARVPEIRYAGFLHHGEKELLEAMITWYILKEQRLFIPDFKEYDWKSYLHGMAESIGELRRYLLDQIREGNTSEIEAYFSLMEELYYFLRTFDYQEGLTRGLRRMVDSMRQMLEKTRADISLVVHQAHFEKSLKHSQKDYGLD